jgi:hypothetical protein
MHAKPVFENLVFDEYDRPVDVAYIGDEPCYVIDDQGFHRHIPSRHVDLQVLKRMGESIHGNETILASLAAKQMGQEDIFTQAMLENQIKHFDDQFEQIIQTGLPEDARAYLGMMGFKIRINFHGEVLEVIQPGSTYEGGGEE